jgi:hypothetical protein
VSLTSCPICIYLFTIITRIFVIWWQKIPLLHAQTSPSYFNLIQISVCILPSFLPSFPPTPNATCYYPCWQFSFNILHLVPFASLTSSYPVLFQYIILIKQRPFQQCQQPLPHPPPIKMAWKETKPFVAHKQPLMKGQWKNSSDNCYRMAWNHSTLASENFKCMWLLN